MKHKLAFIVKQLQETKLQMAKIMIISTSELWWSLKHNTTRHCCSLTAFYGRTGPSSTVKSSMHLKHLDTTEQRNAETERATCKHQIFCSEKHVQSFVLKSTRTVMFLPNSQVLVLIRLVGITSDVTPAALTHLQCPSVWSKQSKHL